MTSRLRALSLYSEFQRTKINGCRKSCLYLLGRFQEKYQRAKNNSVQLGQKFQNPLPTKLVGSLEPHFCPSWTEVEKLTSTQVVSKSKITSTQLAEKSGFNFYSGCVEVKFASKQKARHELFTVSAFGLVDLFNLLVRLCVPRNAFQFPLTMFRTNTMFLILEPHS